ncbi:Hypothetical Protein FCC1311_112582 [Hondaea fermentalgiana]|uniref:Uncharacterized protein n=1 Tax=Hondaea fermentalgiana TaxID=2315210 RepID=A0A2R5GWS9_9STRA|nr:Hypothetical Protein FCC1311_112582 [Hondaea fermentalgiana]|eukprot:GBG35035.1 Hypothetical Protein FCC1311_112582 [Hondaea fermentalgiana]
MSKRTREHISGGDSRDFVYPLVKHLVRSLRTSADRIEGVDPENWVVVKAVPGSDERAGEVVAGVRKLLQQLFEVEESLQRVISEDGSGGAKCRRIEFNPDDAVKASRAASIKKLLATENYLIGVDAILNGTSGAETTDGPASGASASREAETGANQSALDSSEAGTGNNRGGAEDGDREATTAVGENPGGAVEDAETIGALDDEDRDEDEAKWEELPDDDMIQAVRRSLQLHDPKADDFMFGGKHVPVIELAKLANILASATSSTKRIAVAAGVGFLR